MPAQTTISIVGALRYSEADGLQFSITIGEGGKQRTVWMDALPNANDWPGLGKFPEPPKPAKGPWSTAADRDSALAASKVAEEEWRRACTAYTLARNSDPKYRQAALDFIDQQNREPQSLLDGFCWAYRHKVCRVDSTEPETLRDQATEMLLIKHHVLRRERHYERVKREVEALENFERIGPISREPIPESVRLFVWQRDKGQCVKCGARERLEFDHIIPVAAGGAGTERNVQLLCEACNRSKGAAI